MREALASILEARLEFEGARVVDLFAGTGACAFELLSRGAAQAVLVERDPRACADIVASARALGLDDRVHILCADLVTAKGRGAVPEGPFDVAVADPPYVLAIEGVTTLAWLAESGRLAPSAWITLEHGRGDAAAVDRAVAKSSQLKMVSRYVYGDSAITLLRPHPFACSSDAEGPRECELR